ncbi:MAG: tautomerase family protein [Polaromonas sp.]|uniref:tautomerase family protein n=1 Tax=Polaromonas sp. TaxID=1869339 RepID=UPI003266AEB4
MPTAAIEVRRPYSGAEEAALLDAVQEALVTALKVPHWTTSIRLFVHEPQRFRAPPDKGERYTLVTIDCFAGRSIATKRALYQAILQKLGLCGIPADHVKVLLREEPRENWAIRGGLPASDVVLEYDVNI